MIFVHKVALLFTHIFLLNERILKYKVSESTIIDQFKFQEDNLGKNQPHELINKNSKQNILGRLELLLSKNYNIQLT